MTVVLDPAIVARALGLSEATPPDEVLAAVQRGTPPERPRFLRELAPVIASAPSVGAQPDLDRRFLPELTAA